jgi:hypothetical protein
MKYQRMWTVGADYTFDISNGLNLLSEYFDSVNSDSATGSGEGVKYSGLSVNYPIGLLDQISGIYYYDWTNRENYVSLSWQRSYDTLVFYLTVFINPDSEGLDETQTGSSGLPGKGFQIMTVYNY